MSEGDLKLIELRAYRESDLAYIANSWLEDYLSSHFIKDKKKQLSKATYVAMMPRELYYKEQRARIEKILAKSSILVACNAEDENQIFGFVIYRFIGEIGLISWAYVRPVYRGFGIMKKLLDKIGPMDVITHVTPLRRWALRRFELIYNPFMEALDD